MNYVITPSYCKINNFGDELNQLFADVLFPKFLGSSFEPKRHDSSIRLLAIGSYLSASFVQTRSQNERVIILGMGSGYGELPVKQSFGLGRKFPVWIKNQLPSTLPTGTPLVGRFHRIAWVRGPLTARLLGLSPDAVVADAGYLIRLAGICKELNNNRRCGIGFMPHYTAASSSPFLREICESLGFRYIDPRAGVHQVLDDISSCEALMTEALHGAIVSDALRVPWIPLRSSEDIFEFKWLDFCASINIEYSPHQITLAWERSFYSGRNPISLIKNVTTRTRSFASRFIVRRKDTALSILKASAGKRFLSPESFISQVESEFHSRLNELQGDIAAGKLFSTYS